MIRGVLIDLAGVVHDGDAAIPGAVKAVTRLRDAGLPIGFVTNTTSSPKRRVVQRLRGLGLAVGPEDVLTPADAAREWLASHDRAPHLLAAPALAEDFAGLESAAGTAVVVGDVGESLDFAGLNGAFRALDEGADFLALARNRAYRAGDGALSIDSGAVVAALEYAAAREALLVGKPAPAFYAAAVERLGVPAAATVMVGDDVEADVSGALLAGIGQALLVRTGKYRPGSEDAADPAPTAVLDDLAAAAGWILARR